MTPPRRSARGYRRNDPRATRSGRRDDSRGMLSPGDQATSRPTTTDEKWGQIRPSRWGQRKSSFSGWARRLTARDKKALTALIWAHINPYGTFHIDMNTHLDLDPHSQDAQAA